MVLATTDTVLDTVATTAATTARGPLMLSPPLLLRPRLMPIPTTDTTAWATTVLDTADTLVLATTDTVLATTARGPLSPPPSPPLTLMPRLIPTTDTMAMDTDMVSDTMVLDTVPTDTVLATTATAMVCTDTTDKCPAIHPKTSLGITSSSSEKWIAQFGLTPTSATSFSATRLAQARNGEQEAKENQNVMIRRIKKLKPK